MRFLVGDDDEFFWLIRCCIRVRFRLMQLALIVTIVWSISRCSFNLGVVEMLAGMIDIFCIFFWKGSLNSFLSSSCSCLRSFWKKPVAKEFIKSVTICVDADSETQPGVLWLSVEVNCVAAWRS